jgi:CDP-diacylglycerol pyrophosphatase
MLRCAAMGAIGICGMLLTGCALLAQAVASNPNALWIVVHDACVPNQRQFGNPSPCTKVDLAAGYAILKDRVGLTQFLLIPTARVAGIEDPAILAPDAPHYWAQAWNARGYVDQRAGRLLARDEVSLAVNSVNGRTQAQLHIHIDCIKLEVKAALHAYAPEIGPYWAAFPVPLAGDSYLAEKVDAYDLSGVNPFRLLAELPEARAGMGEETLVVTGETESDGRPGFILLAGRSVPGISSGSGEALQDHSCALARVPEAVSADPYAKFRAEGLQRR